MRRFWCGLAVAAASAGALGLFACSGGSPASVTPPAEGGTDAGSDATTMMDVVTVDSTMGNPDTSQGGDTSVPNMGDTAPPPDAPTGCAASATRAQCVKCCAMDDPDGSATYVEDINACACTPSLCGPVDDAGVEDAGLDVSADGGDEGGSTSDGGLGTGACSVACGGKMADPACSVCRAETLKVDGGACYATVRSACEGDPGCKGYLKCVASCPK